ncbi:MAG: hypothetical protein JXX28_09980 [Deltaproteobacteria bacterium]|nr:hypothetical protein [Deltaproteobacteria bacterium]
MRWTLPLLFSLGCGQSQLSPEWQLDRLRILGARTTPAEAAPGDLVAMEALTFGAEGVMWSTCFAPAGLDVPCPADEALRDQLRALDWAALSEEERADWVGLAVADGVFGVQPGWDPVLPIPAELAQALATPELSGGLSVAVALEAWSAAGDREYATKFLRLSLSQAPNLNPSLAAVTVEDQPVSALNLRVGEPLVFTVVPAEGAEESYTYLNSEGTEELRDEHLELRFYASLGDFGRFGPAFNHDVWNPGETAEQELVVDEVGEGELIAVALDGRGGVDWVRLPVIAEP